MLCFAFTGRLWPALTAFWLYYLTRSLVDPVFMTWVNENITDSTVRATATDVGMPTTFTTNKPVYFSTGNFFVGAMPVACMR